MLSLHVGVLVALSGAAGCVLRWLLANMLQRSAGAAFPAGTFAVNVLGSFAIGLVMAIFAARSSLSSPTRIAITAGLLGGFTTFSSFVWEIWALIEARSPGRAAVYLLVSVVAGLGACVAGLFLGRSLAG